MKPKLTSFYIPIVLAFFENEILNETGLSKTSFHRQMIQHFFDNDIELVPQIFEIPQAGEAKFKEQIYLDDEEEDRIEEYIKNYKRTHIKGCMTKNVLTQAMIAYCVHMGMKILERDHPDHVGISTGILYVVSERLLNV